MWLKFIILISAVTCALGQDLLQARKLFKTRGSDETVAIKPFNDPFDGISYRLPNNTKPIHYDIYLSTEIHLGIFDFNGRVTITIEALENTNEIVLHYRLLTINSVSLLRENGGTIQSNVNFESKEDLEFLIIKPTRVLSADTRYQVVINYIGTLRNDDVGFYRSSYIDSSGIRKYLATTQFESTDARHAFPCYDEPAIRASFTIEIRHFEGYHAISNMPVASITPEAENYVRTKFEEIYSMQTYLVAFTISDFDFVEDTTSSVLQRVYAKPSSIANNEAKLAIEESGKILNGFEVYLGGEYALPKMDQAAMPDFAAGAMENWGLVTYREIYLLFIEETGTTRDRENVLATIAHEFAHQWFGNLVSPAWWSYLWLNEGFATLYENYALELVYPGERWADTFLVDTFQWVMETDANPNIRPMSYYVENPDRIDNLFDNVAYSKSGSVLRMFQNAFGDSIWKQGLHNYLERKAFDFATPADLYIGLQAAVDEAAPFPRPNVADYMRSWETQSGFPYITVSRSGSALTIEQNRFMYADRNSQNLWWIPISYVVGSNPNFENSRADFWMGPQRAMTIQSFNLPKQFTENDWLIFNIQQGGYYRVNYDENLWNLIFDQLNSAGFSQIHIFNRAQLIDDAFHFARANLVTFDAVLNVMNYLERETDYIPWASANRANTLLNRWISGSNVYSNYQAYMRKNVDALYKRLGIDIIENEPRVDRYARSIAVNIACQSQHITCLRETNQKLQNLIDNESKPSNDVASVIYCNGIRDANAILFKAVWERALQSEEQSERNTILSALGCVQSQSLLTEYFTNAISPLFSLSISERSRILTSAINNGENSIRTMIFFLKNNYRAVDFFNLVGTICSNIAARVLNEYLMTDFDMLLNELVANEIISQNSANTYRNNAATILAWKITNLDAVEGFFVDDEDTTLEPTNVPTNPPPTNAPTNPPPTNPQTAPTTTTDSPTDSPTTVPTSLPTESTNNPSSSPTDTTNGDTTTTDKAGYNCISIFVLVVSVILKILM